MMAGLFDLTDRHVLVTGGSSGLGRHFADRLAAAGARVTVTARRADALAETVARIETAGGTARALVMVVTEPATIEPALDLILVSRHLERIGDHATNIAENVYFLVHGEQIAQIRRKGDTTASATATPST